MPKEDPIIAMLLQARKARGLRQQDVADKAFISRRALVSIEAGHDCSLSTLRRLCAALDVDIEAKPAHPSRAPVASAASKVFRTARQMAKHQADREVAEAVRVQSLPPAEFSQWLSSTWGRLQEQANRLYADIPRSPTGHSRSFRTLAEKNRFDEARETDFALQVAMRQR
jgi:transcriptional regulator with XRE-family HTH domain